jgi:hypothetical protein
MPEGQHRITTVEPSMSEDKESDGPRLPKVTIAGVVINVDRLDDERGTIWLYDRSGRHLAEIRDVAEITIGTTWDDVCAAK